MESILLILQVVQFLFSFIQFFFFFFGGGRGGNYESKKNQINNSKSFQVI